MHLGLTLTMAIASATEKAKVTFCEMRFTGRLSGLFYHCCHRWLLSDASAGMPALILLVWSQKLS